MKKLMLSIVALWIIVLAVSCATKSANSQDDPLEPGSPEMSAALGEVYNDYDDLLNLTGAAKYTVVRGDDLSHIAAVQYGKDNAYFFPIIMLASKNTVIDPDLLEPGMELIIPDLNINLSDDKIKRGIKKFLNDIADVYSRKQDNWASVTEANLQALANNL
ncbi:MAG: hypothetical protein LBM77_09805 [Spirochaetaceae bacterium]|jgi:hypothetical protein|nr:hypothetical protein [Spirochaetaceae bacterium]